LQWHFLAPWGGAAPEAWAHVAAEGAPGGSGVIVAVLDTGVAYANHGRFRRSPDFLPSQFVPGYDFVGHSPHADDHNGHGTHVAGTIAEATNNGYGLTGLAFGAKIMPVRVLNAHGDGDARNIAAGVLFAVRHGAKVINMSLEFSEDVTARQIPELIGAIAYAHRKGVFVTGASGNEGHATVAYPARARGVIAVGATTEHGCLADFSNDGRGLDLVAPGGGSDANLSGDNDCHPVGATGRDIYQITFAGQNPRKFGLPSGYEGTSMASPHVAGTAALNNTLPVAGAILLLLAIVATSYRQTIFAYPGGGGSYSPLTEFSALLGIQGLFCHHVPAERFTVEEALRAYSADAAMLSFDEGRRGVLAPGMDADFVVLEKALDNVAPDEIRAVRVVATVVGGDVRYRA